MSEFTVSISLDNAAFDPDPEPEIARLLRHLADTLDARTGETSMDDRPFGVYDVNGNRVGHWQVTA